MQEEKTFIKGLGLLGEGGVGGNVVAVDVKDGKIIRIRPFHYDWKYKPEELGPRNLEARGKVYQARMTTLVPPHSLAFKKRVFSPNRILYPLKRVDWDPNGDRNTQNRGTSKYVRISWDEALEIIASEIKRIKKKYSTAAILAQADGHGSSKVVHAAHGLNTVLLKLLGGYTLQTRNPDSWEGWFWGAKHAWGMDPVGMESQFNVMHDVAQNTELILFWGHDPETTSWGFQGQGPGRVCYWFTEMGIKSIYICPDLNYGAAVHADKWIPIVPNTDAAMQLAIAYVWITEGTYDKDYVATHTVGFDKFADYVLGKEDGIAKTPKWAEPLCGVPSRIIKALARLWTSKRTSISHGCAGPMVRGQYSTEPARLEVLLLAMQGLGKPGVHQALLGLGNMEFPPKSKFLLMPMYASRGSTSPNQTAEIHGISMEDLRAKWEPPGWVPIPIRRPTDDRPEKEKIPQIIPKTLIPDAILNPPISWYSTTLWGETVEDQFVKYTYPAKGCPEVHMIWTDTPCWITCWNDSNSYVTALRSPKIEFILAQHPWLENDCLLADIILPVSTKMEEEDINMDMMGDRIDILYHEGKCMERVGESRTDHEVVAMIAEKLGLLKEYTEGKSDDEWIRFAFDNSGASPYISWEEFKEKGYWVVPTNPEFKNPGSKPRTNTLNFYENPEKYPLKTPSGKIEFYSQRLAKSFPDDDERPPVPHWIPYGKSHQESRLHARAKKYPLLVVSNHPRWRVHANLDDISWFKEIPTGKVRGPDGYLYEPLWMNPADAAARGIKNGDVVKIYNERGAVLAGAYIAERIIPGAISIDHGAVYDPIVPGKLDRGGAINTITPHKTTSPNATGMVVSGFLVEVERANLDELMKQYPEAFKRPYHKGYGLCLERALAGNE